MQMSPYMIIPHHSHNQVSMVVFVGKTAICHQNICKHHHDNPLHAKLFRENKTYTYIFVSFQHIDMIQVVEILPQVRQELTYST